MNKPPPIPNMSKSWLYKIYWFYKIYKIGKPIAIAFLTFSFGAISVLAFAPFSWYLVPIITLMWLLRIWKDSNPLTALQQGWLFGLGFMGFGVFWLRISISQFGGVDALLATISTIMFITVVAAFFSFAGWLSCYLTKNPVIRLSITIPAAWGLMEWMRSWVLTGFPWLALGYSQIDSPLRSFAPIFGVYGISWILMLSIGWLMLGIVYWYQKCRAQAIKWLIMALLPWAIGWILANAAWVVPYGKSLQISIIQPSIPQAIKWEPQQLIPTLKTYRQMTREAKGSLIIWPETAIPAFLHQVEKHFLLPLAQELANRNVKLLVGVPVLDPDGKRYYNGAVLAGVPNAFYYKRHLVPFGEFLPFRKWLGPFLDFLQIPMSNFAPGIKQSTNIQINNHIAGISICYEDAFGAEVRTALPKATFLVNLSNDAWFGDSLAPHQHLEIARMRALEMGRPLVRATNSGISALIDAAGQVQTASKLFAKTTLTGTIQPMQGTTLFVYWGNSMVIILMCISLIGGIPKFGVS